MNKTCEIVQDVLPLYCDKICSKASVEMVEKHLLECQECQTMLNDLQNGTDVNSLKCECDEIISHHNQTLKRKSLSIGVAIAAVLAVPILIAFIVNLSVGKTLDWFFIVLTSLLVVASVTVVPFVAETRKAFWTITLFTVSLLLLLFCSCIYSGGNWFVMAAIPILFGMSVLFMPVVLRQLPIKNNFFDGKIALLSFAFDTLLLYAIIITAGFYTNSPNYWGQALLITTYYILPVWASFLVIKYTHLHCLAKSGIVAIITGVFVAVDNNFIMWLNGKPFKFEMWKINLFAWNEQNLDANIKFIIIASLCIIGIVLVIVGNVLKKRKPK